MLVVTLPQLTAAMRDVCQHASADLSVEEIAAKVFDVLVVNAEKELLDADL